MEAFSAHHIQRGNVTAIVWGAPGERCREEDEERIEAGTGTAGRDDDSRSMGRRVDAEELTRGRRAAMPFVQQCDLVFPLPDRYDRDDQEAAERSRKQSEAERRAETFVAEALGTGFYYRVRGPLSALLRQPFLGEYVLKGGFSALALNAPSDQGNSFAVLPSGVLLLSLDRESFQTLGLPGEAAPTRPKGKSKRAGAGAGSTGGSDGVAGGGAGGCDRYVSSFDLFSEAFRPGKRLHDRLLSCLVKKGAKERDVDMVIYSWGDNLKGDDGETIKRGETVRGNRTRAPERSCLVSQGSDDNTDAVETETREAVGEKSGGNGEKHSQIDGEQNALGLQEGCCREISFPSSFSRVDKIQLKPDVRFFREVCCPDLDFVGQGLIRARADACTGTTAMRVEETPEEAIGRAQTAVETETDRCPSRPTKCRLMLDLFDWLGAVSCGLEPLLGREPSPPDPFLSKFETPRHLRFMRHRTICRVRLRGHLPPLMVSRCVKAARDAAAATAPLTTSVKSEDTVDLNGCSWGSVVAWPFRDAPRSYPGADAPCAGGVRTRRGGQLGAGAVVEVAEWK